MKLDYELRVPTGSADGQWVIFDAESDNKDVIAIVDPDCILEELSDSPEKVAALLASAPELKDMIRRLKSFITLHCPTNAPGYTDVCMAAFELVKQSEGRTRT